MNRLGIVRQRLNKALILPMAVLVAAAILLGVGAADFAVIPPIASQIMVSVGGAIFGNMPLLFAIGVALGFTDNDGVSALAAVVGFVVMVATMGITAGALGFETKAIMGIESIDTGLFGGILMGAVAAYMFNRFFRLQLPTYLWFFSGKRFVPIITSFVAIGLGIILGYVWPSIGIGIHEFSIWASQENAIPAFGIYGFVERLLLPFGLHHSWNVPFFFNVGQYMNPETGEVITGEIQRYIAGDPTAGNMAGGYLFKMWGLPAAAMAIWATAEPENRAKIGVIMISVALISFLFGITELIELFFLLVAPILYLFHAILAAVAYMICILLEVKHGITFSHGLGDFVVLFANSSRGLWLLWLGPLWALLYFGVFYFSIKRFDLMTLGRGEKEVS